MSRFTPPTMRTFAQTAMADEILCLDDGKLVLRIRTEDSRPDRNVWGEMPRQKTDCIWQRRQAR